MLKNSNKYNEKKKSTVWGDKQKRCDFFNIPNTSLKNKIKLSKKALTIK